MLRNSEGEKEIVLGNKQLFGIFFVVAVLLGIAFTGGYMVGNGTKPKAAAANAQPQPAANTSQAIGETHSIPADSPDAGTAATDSQASPQTGPAPEASSPAPGSRHSATPASSEAFNPAPGERFLQVAAVSREEADEVAEVLHKKGFRAHAAPKPGNPKIYRVLIGPIRDAGDLSSTRDALRRTGFSEVITQRY
jgi:cell division septation protein DedD